METGSCPSLPDFGAVPGIPRGEEGAVFAAPWEAKAFALVVHLHQRGAFAWADWVNTLSAEIAADRERATETPYYLLWLAAAERLVASQGLVAEEHLRATREALHTAQALEHHHDHGHDHHHHGGHGHHDHEEHGHEGHAH
ncbi:MAG: nitrile hydratase accessory protein [Gammaproteobacteria bacterium]|nr:nitrile hydratase accessory protein [Gammaproteobacteria bacterium]